MGVFRRFYLVRPLSALLLCLPGVLLCLWYAWSAYASLDCYHRTAGEAVSLTWEDFHLQLFDVLRRDLRRMRMPPPPDPSRVALFSFHMSSDSIDRLLRGAELEAKRPYVPAKLKWGAAIQDLEMRLRGNRHWHILGRQKSLKVRLPKGELLDGHRVFNLINDPAPMVVGEQIILDLSRQHGVLTPASAFARVQINQSDLGLFHFETQPDESLLRTNRRVPGSIYSGNLPPSVETKELWSSASRWKKVAWRGRKEEASFRDLERMLGMIGSASVLEFADFARNEVNLQAFATFDALDVAFGGDQHDFRGNHKLYFDPYRGRWEPVAWNFRGFKHQPMLNLVENPLLLRLKLVPDYLFLRNRILYNLLVESCSASSVQERGEGLLKMIAPELASDPYWDAYKLLPQVDGFHRRMVRPMDLRRAALVFGSEMVAYTERHAYLLRELVKNPLWMLMGQQTPSGTAVHLVVDGLVGVRLTGFRAVWPPGCKQTGWQVLKEGKPLGSWSTGDLAELPRPEDLYPGVSLVARSDPSPIRGEVRTEAVAVSYPFLLRSGCAPEKFEAQAIQLATDSRIRSQPATAAVLRRLPEHTLRVDEVPRLVPGEVSPHPWMLRRPAAATTRIGPGTVAVSRTRVFEAQESVEIAPGTRLRLGGGASLIFLGQVFFRGSRSQPIVLESAGGQPWGGIALQGRQTAGSVLEHVVASGGTVPAWRLIPYPGMLNLHDTGDISLRHCRFGSNQQSEDVVHAAYVDDLSVEDTLVEDAAKDAFDLEFVSGRLRQVEVRRAGDEGVDLMGSRLELQDSALLDCGGNGISAGEQSELRVQNTLIAGCQVGVLAKNASRVDLSHNLLYRNQTGVQVYQREVRYQGASWVQADGLFVVGSTRDIKRQDQPADGLDLGWIQRRLMREGSLDHLRLDVLGLERWEDLPGWVEARSGGGK